MPGRNTLKRDSWEIARQPGTGRRKSSGFVENSLRRGTRPVKGRRGHRGREGCIYQFRHPHIRVPDTPDLICPRLTRPKYPRAPSRMGSRRCQPLDTPVIPYGLLLRRLPSRVIVPWGAPQFSAKLAKSCIVSICLAAKKPSALIPNNARKFVITFRA